MDSLSFLTDLTGYVRAADDKTPEIKHSTNSRAGKDMDMSDYLKLMVSTFQNQSIDDVASTSDMMNQMVQMSVIQAVTNLNKIVSESSSMSYAASLVGKEVTIGQQDGTDLTKIVGKVTGTGMLDGEQVIFMDNGEMFKLSEVIAVGRVPENLTSVAVTGERSSLPSGGGLSNQPYSNLGPISDAALNSLMPKVNPDLFSAASPVDYSGANYSYVTADDGSMRVVYNDSEISPDAYAAAAEEQRSL